MEQQQQNDNRRKPVPVLMGVAMVTLWDLLTVVCFVMPAGGALASARLAKAGFSGIAVAIVLGLALSFCFAWAMRVIGKIAGTHIRRQPSPRQNIYFMFLYLAAMLWIVFGFVLGASTSTALVRRIL